MRVFLNWLVYMFAFLVGTIFIPGMIKNMPFMMLTFLMVLAVLVMRKDFVELVSETSTEPAKTNAA